LIEPTPAVIAVVDDVLTAGAHFKAMKRLLMETFQDAHIVGLFLARRVPNTEIDG
jgi:predicted amidophosphoribosyltransferase